MEVETVAVSHRLLAGTAVVFALQIAGCSPRIFRPADLSNTFAAPRAIAVEVQGEFAACRSLEDVQNLLQKMESSPKAQLWAESLLSGWGQQGNWYDVAVVEFLLKHWPSAYGDHARYGPDHERFNTRRLFDITQHVLRENPELVYQVFWYFQWERGPMDFSKVLMRDLETGPARGPLIEGEAYPWLLLSAGVASGIPAEGFDGSLATGLSFDSLETSRLLINGLVASQRPFLKYDHELGRYVVDEDAKAENRYLTPEDQVASPRETPLPDWTADSI